MKMRKNTKTKIAGGSSRRRGFALLITITLLAFLVLLLVSLATLTRVETQVASNNQKIAQARQNALMALNIAVGQLQKYAGPDNRVTNTSTALSNTTLPNLTGVWTTESATDQVPDTWLIGTSATSDAAASVIAKVPDPKVDSVAASAPLGESVFLVGDNNVTDKAQRIKVEKLPIKMPAGTIPGIADAATVGNYGWWIGDQGVKASLALADRSEAVNYGPWADADARGRLRQQIGSSVNYFKQAGTVYGFDPLDSDNVSLVGRVQSNQQLAMLKPVSGATLPTYLKNNFHDITSSNYSVLANTLPSSSASRGLLQDLSTFPSLLGSAFVQYANYDSYMDTPTAGDPKRRYKMRPYVSGTGSGTGLPLVSFNLAPVVSDFLIRFRVSRLTSTDNSVLVRCKVIVSLWNPYTSALAPEDLYVDITGLPTITLADRVTPSIKGDLNLQDPARLPPEINSTASPGTIRLKLTFPSTVTSWLPGRVHTWVTPLDHSPNLKFDGEDSSDDSSVGAGWRYSDVPQLVGGTAGLTVSAPAVGGTGSATSITVKLSTVANSYDLAQNTGLSYPLLNVGSNENGWKFGYGFRIQQPNTGTKDRLWRASTADLRAKPVERGQATDFKYGVESPDGYDTQITAADTKKYLIFRPLAAGTSSASTSHDVPMFELPRRPFLSVGELQHMTLPGSKMFSIGNSWGSSARSGIDVNALFDRFFFSGLVTGVTPDFSLGQPLPNWNMRTVGDASVTTVRSASLGYSSAYLLQGGGFNLNSTSTVAWRAALSRTRFATTKPFTYPKTNATSGAAIADGSTSFDQDTTLGSAVPAPVFFRFPQSAQETMDWSAVGDRGMSTQTFRQGIRGGGDTIAVSVRALTTTQIETLAGEIVKLIKAKTAASGPFRSVGEFLNPTATAGDVGILEKAITNANINPPQLASADAVANPSFPGYGALTLTSADVMGALAPYAKVRSDTFIVRTYGDAVNPATGAVEGRAYAEAIVQRLPTPVADSDLSPIQAQAKPAGAFGRRFKIVSFRWLTASDI